jgi:hypothetical protein
MNQKTCNKLLQVKRDKPVLVFNLRWLPARLSTVVSDIGGTHGNKEEAYNGEAEDNQTDHEEVKKEVGE